MTSSPDVVVVGGGIVGCATAYYLARRGVRVTLLERARIAADASSVAAGTLGPLSHVPGPGPHLDFCRAALQMYAPLAAELLETSGIDIEYTPVGKLRVAFTEDQAAALQADISWHCAAGFATSWLTADEAHRLEPALGPEVLGALFSPQEHHVRSVRVTEAFAKGAARHGAVIHIGAEVLGLTTAGSRITGVQVAGREPIAAGAVVLAGGAWTGMWDWLGPRLPVVPIGGQTVTLSTAVNRQLFTHSISGDASLLVARRGGTVIAGVTVERQGYSGGIRITAGNIARILNGVIRLVPAVGAAQFVAAAGGLRPLTPDRLPIIGPAPGWDGVVIATGHYRDGILLGPLTGLLTAELLTSGRPHQDLSLYRADRFNGAAGVKPMASEQ